MGKTRVEAPRGPHHRRARSNPPTNSLRLRFEAPFSLSLPRAMRSRRDFLYQFTSALAAVPVLTKLPTWVPSADGFTELRRGVGMYKQRGGTIGWLINNEGVVVIDTQYPESASSCWMGLKERSDLGLDLVINTHHHGDHVGGNGVFAEHTDRIVAHANVPGFMRAAAEEDEEDQQTYPTQTFEDAWSETIGDETLNVRFRGPAHTGGDAVIRFDQANVLHLGDLVFNRAYPFIDVDGGADSIHWIETLETLHASLNDDTLVIHGHGNPEFGVSGGRDDLLVMRDFLSALNEYVTQRRQAGASLQEMQQKEVLEGFEAFNFDWGLSLADCIEAVYREQTAG